MRHKGRLALHAQFPTGGLVRFPQGLRQRRVHEKTAKVFVKKADFFQPEDEGAEGGGDAGGPANQLPAQTHAFPQQRNVRAKLRRPISVTQSLNNLR